MMNVISPDDERDLSRETFGLIMEARFQAARVGNEILMGAITKLDLFTPVPPEGLREVIELVALRYRALIT